jgi:SAM-dependent methyltransferase
MTVDRAFHTGPEDVLGAATLERMALAPAYNRWMFDRLERWIGSRVLEVGSGIGNMSQFFAERDKVVLTDTEAAYRERLRERFRDRPGVSVTELSLPGVPPDLAGLQFDTIICLNVLEHIEDDAGTLKSLHGLLEPGGRLVLLVPALQSIYGSLDRALGHYRRYSRKLLRERYADAGLRMRHLEHFNMAGILGWWFTGRVLRRELIPTGSLALYDRLVPLFRLERLLPVRIGQSLIAIGERSQ